MSNTEAEVIVRGADNLVRTLTIALDKIAGSGRGQAAIASAQVVAARSRRLAPVRTGTLVSSISYAKSGGDSAVVKASARYSGYVHWGTKFMRPRPFLVTAMESESHAIEQIFAAIAEAALAKVKGV